MIKENNHKINISAGNLLHPLRYIKNQLELYKFRKAFRSAENLCLRLEGIDASSLELVGAELINNLKSTLEGIESNVYFSMASSFFNTVQSNKDNFEKNDARQIDLLINRWLPLVKSNNFYQAEYDSFSAEIDRTSEVFVDIRQKIEWVLNKERAESKLKNIKERIRDFINKTSKAKEILLSTNFGLMSPYDFEEFIARLFKFMGYETEATQKSGDYGVDVVANNGVEKIAIQCKKYHDGNKVGNQAVQMLLGAMQFKNLRADKGILITTSGFTKQAYEQAEDNDIELWDKEFLHQKVRDYILGEKGQRAEGRK